MRQFTERLALCALLSSALWAVPSFTVTPKVVNITHSTARLVWIASENPTSATVEWGITTTYAASRTGAKSSAAPWTGSVLISALAPSTLYYWRVTLNTGGSVATGSFTTATEPSPHPATPTAPAAVDVSMPMIDGNTYNVDSNCSNLQSILDTLAGLTGSLNHQVVIPAGTTCYGNWTFPARSAHTGWVVVRSSAAGTAAFPPEGVRWTTNWQAASTLATFVTRTLGGARAAQTALDASATCTVGTYGGGGFRHITGLPTALFPVERCDDDNPAYTGTTWMSAMSWSLPVTVTVTGHSIAEGQIVNIPAGNGYVAAGTYYAYKITANTFDIYVSGSGTLTPMDLSVVKKYALPSHTKSTVDPTGGCTEETWWYRTDTGAYWWCVQGAWVRFDISASTSAYYHATARVSGDKYRFIGLEFKNQQVAQAPSGIPDDWEKPGGSSWNEQGRVYTLVDVDVGANNAVFDRCYFNAVGKPARPETAIRNNGGDDFALIDSTATNFARWRKDAPTQADATEVLYHYRGNRLLLRNNLLDAGGITYYTPNPEETGAWPVTDITAERNEFRKQPGWRNTSSTPWSLNYPQRHSLELKQGHRVLIRGNYFNYSWSGINAGGFLMLSPKEPYDMPAAWGLTSWSGATFTLSGTTNMAQPGDVVYVTNTDAEHNGLWEVASNGCPSACQEFTVVGSPAGSGSGGNAQVRAFAMTLKDLDVRDNTFYQGTEFWRGGIVRSGGEAWMRPAGPIRVANNLAVDLDIRSYAAGGRVDANGVFVNGDNGPRLGGILGGDFEDVQITHNTFYGNRGNMPTFFLADNAAGDVSEGLVFCDNLFLRDASAAYAPVRGGTTGGTATLNERFKRYTSDPWSGNAYWTSTKNVLCCGESASWSASHPTGYLWPAAEADVKWLRPQLTAGYDFRLRHDSPYKSGGASRASDDLDIGVDVDALKAAQGAVENVRVRGITASAAVVSYLAPDSEACTVEYGTSATWGTGTRTGDGGGDRVRNVTLSPLSGATMYYYRVLCAVEQPSGSFRTR